MWIKFLIQTNQPTGEYKMLNKEQLSTIRDLLSAEIEECENFNDLDCEFVSQLDKMNDLLSTVEEMIESFCDTDEGNKGIN